jgi:hypothetical protein
VKENTCPSWAFGFATRLLAYDEYEGCSGRVARTAFILSEKRRQNNLPGSPEDDWKKAEEKVLKALAKEAARRLA